MTPAPRPPLRQRDERRFDLLLKSGRLFELKAAGAAERQDWSARFQHALVEAASVTLGMASLSVAASDAERHALSVSTRSEDEAALEEAHEAEALIEEEEEDVDGDGANGEASADVHGEAVGEASRVAASGELEISARSASMRAASTQLASPAQARYDLGPAQAGHLTAQPVVVQARYLSRVQRAKLANAAKVSRREPPSRTASQVKAP